MSYKGFDSGGHNVPSDCETLSVLLLKDAAAQIQDQTNINPFVWHGLQFWTQ